MLTISQAADDVHLDIARELLWEYLQWACLTIQRELGIAVDARAVLDYDLGHLHAYTPPDGRLLLARDDGATAGCVWVRTMAPRVAEIKRMYVRPTHRRKGIGRALLRASIEEMRWQGYSALRLESSRLMAGAHALYRSEGFRPAAPYAESEIPPEFHAHYLFMELSPIVSDISPGCADRAQ
jgi:GNAT superfamily N-acetyltransferase